ncbi:glycosyltransferase family 2 protein [Acidicapsa dinghuensis]|uniref:Glycosyltransferase family 2 protein n=1 Tax=Acidicapsa dinghuensis TaxID=2218256 RepID=A0ABW1ED22_9BACT|nr:glycosyltransferase [Acidicapsa dinghuensis]
MTASQLQPNLYPTLSVVIIGRNEGERLRRCIVSAQSIQSWKPSEILYVDSASTDGSPAMAADLGATVLTLPPGAFTAARARNLGWRSATGELVLFLDGDTILNADFPLSALAEMNKDAANAAVWGHRREASPCSSVYVRVLDLDWVYRPGETPFCGGDVLIRRAALDATGGYDDTLIAGEEPEMCRRMRKAGWRIQHIDHPMTLHDLAITRFRQYWRRSQRAGYAYAAVSSRFRHTSDPFWSSDARGNRLRGLFWILSPLLAIAACFVWASLFPFALWILLLLVLAVRTAWQSRWKSTSARTLFLYGLHSHLQQIPILSGQIQFLMNRNKTLMEYKDVSGTMQEQSPEQPQANRP